MAELIQYNGGENCDENCGGEYWWTYPWMFDGVWTDRDRNGGGNPKQCVHFLHKHSQFAKCFVSAKTCYYLANIMTLVLTIATKCGGEYWLVNIKPVQVGWRTSNNATSNSIKLSMVCSPPVYLLWRLSLPIYQHNTVIINVSVDLCQFGIFSTSLLTRKQ